MLNYIWLGLVLAAVILGGVNGNLKEVADASFERAKVAVLDTAFPLIGIMALWLGIMRLAERAGLVALLARWLRPLMRWLFPDVPVEHPAMGSMLMNIAANMLGLGNAATPLGLRAMKDLESLNPHPGTATNAMCTFLAINTSSVQLIPVTAVAVLSAQHAKDPFAIVGTSIMATSCAAICGVAAAKFLGGLPFFRVPRSAYATTAPTGETAATLTPDKPAVKESATLKPLPVWGMFVLAAYFVMFLWFFARLAFPETFHITVPPDDANRTLFIRIVSAVSTLSIPLLLSLFPLYAALRGVRVYEELIDGAKEGFDVAIKIVPYLVAMLVAIGMFRAAHGIDMLSNALGPGLKHIGFPVELLPMVLIRPLSGSGTFAMFTDLATQFGADSLIARTAGTIYGSTETTFYVLAVYFGAVGVKNTRYAVIAGLLADTVGVIASILICRAMFGG